ncbi:MAG: phosphatase PAP2 family protein [Rhabdochlamydiaceae bacterium]
MSHVIELKVIQFVQQFKNPIFDAFFSFLDLFDRHEFFFVVIPAFWLGKGWKTGLRLFYILFLSSFTNHLLKAIFLSPRPFHLDPTLGIIKVAGYGFPSGAAQTVILLSGLLMTHWKSKWKCFIAFMYIFLVSFSRIYLGVHFPTDIIAGWMVGFGLLAFYAYVRPPIEKYLKKLPPLSLLLVSQLVPLLLIFLQKSYSVFSIGGCAIGMGMGLFINNSYGCYLSPSKTNKESTLRVLIGVWGTFICYFLISKVLSPDCYIAICLKFIVLGLWVATGSLLICRQFLRSSDHQIKVKEDG